LWEVQYTNINSNIDAPLKPPTDESGNPLSYLVQGSRTLFLPTLGLGVEGRMSPNFRLELQGSGFGIPHHGAMWDAHASLIFRFGHFDVVAGVKAYHFKTTPKNEQYFAGTLKGAFAGLQWHSDR